VGFEREYGVLKRLGATPLGRPRLLGAKTLAILVVEAMQILVLWPLCVVLGWDPSPGLGFIAAVVLGTVAFAGLGLCLAGSLRALVVLAAANGLYLVLLLLSGMFVPLDELPAPVEALAKVLPSTALAEVVRGTLTEASVAGRAWTVLTVWAIAAPLLATRLFRWE
jgi:ABC-2 type transport system permease protein